MKDTKFLIIGFSGAGKTHYLEQRLAEGFDGVDLDQLILSRYCEKYSSTRELILDIGLEKFRDIEFESLQGWLANAQAREHLSLGGGAIHESSLQWLNNRDDWQALYLDKSLSDCVHGMKQRGESYLLELDPAELGPLYEKRRGLFQQLKNIKRLNRVESL